MPQVKAKILIVDDQLMNRELLRDYIEIHQQESMMAEDGIFAIDQLENNHPDIVLLDLMMPRMDGFEVLQYIRNSEKFSHLPVIIISALDELSSITKAIEMGADDYLTKPFDPHILSARLKWCLQKKQLHDLGQKHQHLLEVYNRELKEQVEKQVQVLFSAHQSLIFALSRLAESRDEDTGKHLERMREYCHLLARNLARREIYKDIITEQFIFDLYAASPLHDIGKVGIPDSILNKKGSLTREEFDTIKTHTAIGGKTLRQVMYEHPENPFLEMGIEIAEHHHEMWNGKGYPDGLAGYNIPLSARILSLADVYDALTSKRCYKRTYSHEEAMEIMKEEGTTRFDPDILEVFFEIEENVIAIHGTFQDIKS
jgi:cyclic di-GMP phosphodiesterase